MANPFRNPVLARAFDTLVASHAAKSPGLFLPDGTPRRGGSHAVWFWRGAEGSHDTLFARDPASRRTLAYACYRAGRAAVAEVQA
jgi:hypothetical protein